MQALFFIFLYFSIIFSLGNIRKKFSHFVHFFTFQNGCLTNRKPRSYLSGVFIVIESHGLITSLCLLALWHMHFSNTICKFKIKVGTKLV